MSTLPTPAPARTPCTILILSAKPGQTTAIIGSTGCGKTSLLHLITRFYDVTGGSVTVDGVDVRQMPQSTLLLAFGYVPQRAYLFSGRLIPT